MSSRSRIALGALALAAAFVSACSDATAPQPAAGRTPTTIAFSGGTNDSSTTSGGGVGGGGGGTYQSCGILSADIQSYNIVVYTTRTGIGFSGTATNCGTRKEAFEVDVVDTNTDPACVVDVPHFIAPRNTDPGVSTTWQANSTLVPCQGVMHSFELTLWDTKTGQKLATTTASAFL